ncbi:MAG: hypothetical protein BWY21_00990 [Parcubacteria group bacterium ADurb.Bin216]|nr:MAG: hypothetical protein BWY21_00990 [Parcubacteria group bacterium ADurb.Bin216]
MATFEQLKEIDSTVDELVDTLDDLLDAKATLVRAEITKTYKEQEEAKKFYLSLEEKTNDIFLKYKEVMDKLMLPHNHD